MEGVKKPDLPGFIPKSPLIFLEIKTSAFTFALPKIRVKNAYNSTISKKRKRNYQG
jgi:hypothetical protein